jgi:Leucine-rich repeat (LRR) protein
VLLIDLSSQSFYLSCDFQGTATKIKCEQAYLTNKTDFELVLSPKHISSENISEIYFAAFYAPDSKIRNNLTRFPVEMFDFFPKMLKLQIIHYLMEMIVFDDSMTKLKYLFISDNELKYFKSTLTTETAEISFLSILGNQLTVVDQDTFKGMNNMRELDLFGNKITSIHPESFAHMKVLQKINLNKNQMKSLPLEFYQSFPANITQIILGSTGISEIPNGAFKNFNNLAGLSLYKNKLKTFIARDLELSYCKTLDLGSNTIEQVNFEGLKGLKSLDLDSNLLTTFYAAEVGLESCEYLNIDRNNLTDFNLSNVEKLDIVSMESNNLTRISSEMFSQDADLARVYFQSNQITSVDKKILDLLAKPDMIGLGKNPCVKYESRIYLLKQCFKNFEKEKGSNRLTIMEN